MTIISIYRNNVLLCISMLTNYFSNISQILSLTIIVIFATDFFIIRIEKQLSFRYFLLDSYYVVFLTVQVIHLLYFILYLICLVLIFVRRIEICFWCNFAGIKCRFMV